MGHRSTFHFFFTMQNVLLDAVGGNAVLWYRIVRSSSRATHVSLLSRAAIWGEAKPLARA